MSAAQALAAVATLGPVSPAIAAAYALGYADATAAAAAAARPTIASGILEDKTVNISPYFKVKDLAKFMATWKAA
eukprot:gene6578-5763_t